MKRITSLIFLSLLGISLGAGSTQSPKAEGEGESLSQQVMYKGDNFVLEHHRFSIVCNLTLFDQLKWTHNGRAVVSGDRGYSVMNMPSPQGFSGSRLTVANSRLYHAGKYKCSSIRQRFHTVYILCDSPTINPVKYFRRERTLNLTCNITNNEGSPFPLDWFKNDTKVNEKERVKILQLNSSLIISKTEADDEGLYRCEVRNDTVVDKLQSQTFRVVWLELNKMPKSSSITVQEQLVLECPIRGKPEPTIIWKKDDRPISEVFNGTRAEFEPNEDGIQNGKLLINNVDRGDRGNYTCTVTIFSRTFTTFTFIRVKDIYAALWPFLGIVVEVLVLGIVIFIFEKRRAKAEFEESDTDQGNDQ